METEKRKKIGARNKAKGREFELFVRKDLMQKGCVVVKFDNDVDLDKSTIIQAKRSYNPFTKRLGYQNGFPDFVYFNKDKEIIGLEVKSNGKLSAIEKDKLNWYIKHNTFTRVEVASREKVKNRVCVKYIEYLPKL
jgi:hypothetical protein